MDDLTIIKKDRVPALSFRWRSSDGKRQYPQDMATRHLFNTVVMIWNHTMPDDAKTHNYQVYSFNPFIYTPDYMMTAICVMLPVLLNRRDLTPFMKSRLDFMASYFNQLQFKLAVPQPAIPHETMEGAYLVPKH